MSLPPPQPDFSAIDAAFVDLVLAFLERVLHVPTPVRDSIKHMEITEVAISHNAALWSFSRYQEWAVTVILCTAIPGMGDTLWLAVNNRGGNYAISKLFFQPGWKPVVEQAEWR